ncbi:MAG: ABC transporter permease [Promethearchaeota archaeon]
MKEKLKKKDKSIASMKKWFRDLKCVIKKDLLSTKRVKKYFFSAVIPPLVMLIVFTLLFAFVKPESYTVMVVDDDNTEYSNQMVNYITNITSDFGPWFNVINIDNFNKAKSLLNEYKYLGLIYIPKGFQANITSVDPNMKGIIILIVQNINNDYVKNYIQRIDEAVLTFNSEVHVSPGHVDNFEINLQIGYIIDQKLSLLKGTVVGIISIYGIICGMVFGALNVAKEYENKTMIEIINSPIKRTAFVASKQLIAIVLGSIVTLIISIITFLIFNVQFRGNVFIVLIAFILSTWIHSGIGCLIGFKLKKVMNVILICIVSSMLMWFFTGGFAPLKILGNVVYYISRFIPATYWSEILYSETFLPSVSYMLSRMLILTILSVIITFINFYIISREGFKF